MSVNNKDPLFITDYISAGPIADQVTLRPSQALQESTYVTFGKDGSLHIGQGLTYDEGARLFLEALARLCGVPIDVKRIVLTQDLKAFPDLIGEGQVGLRNYTNTAFTPTEIMLSDLVSAALEGAQLVSTLPEGVRVLGDMFGTSGLYIKDGKLVLYRLKRPGEADPKTAEFVRWLAKQETDDGCDTPMGLAWRYVAEHVTPVGAPIAEVDKALARILGDDDAK